MSVFNPAFVRQAHEHQRIRQLAEERERDALPPPPLDGGEPVRLVITGQDARALRVVAAARAENVAVLARAVVASALRNGQAEEMLGERRAEDIAGGHGRRPVAGLMLTRLQCAVLYLIGEHGGTRGWCGWSAAALARLLPAGVRNKQVTGIVATLAGRGLLERGVRVGNAPRPTRLTDLGRAVWWELAGGLEDGRGGK